jgi:hypothetical protein
MRAGGVAGGQAVEKLSEPALYYPTAVGGTPFRPARRRQESGKTAAFRGPQRAGSPMKCRPGCGACCIAPSISTPIPGMPTGKPATVRCVQLDEQERCELFGSPERPQVCRSLQPERRMCGGTREQALSWLLWLEVVTSP